MNDGIQATVKALAFDVGGSVFDWQTAVRRKVVELAEIHSAEIDDYAFAHAWRRRMFGMLGEVRSGARERANADELHRLALDDLVPGYPGFELSDPQKDELTLVWHQMDVWEDFPAALEQLRRHYKVVILSVLSWSILVDSSKHAGISWDGILSCEFLSHYKPMPQSYQQCASLLRLEPQEVMMVAVHPMDLAAAAHAGLKTGYVKPKLDEAGSQGDPASFDVVADNYADFVAQMCK